MSNLLETMKSHLENGVVDPSLVSEVVKEFDQLRHRTNELEVIRC